VVILEIEYYLSLVTRLVKQNFVMYFISLYKIDTIIVAVGRH
jgi:hypothetical protein